MMSTVVFISEQVVEKKLVKSEKYRYHPDSATKEKIISDVKAHLKSSLEDYIIDLNIEVNLKKYDTKNQP